METRMPRDMLNDPVAQHMRRDFTHVGVGQTVGEALAEVRRRQPGGRIVYFYVLDPEGRLQGVVPTRRLLLSPLDTPVADLMVRRVIALPASATVLEACEFFIMHRLLAFPVVDEERRVVGVVDVELYTDELSDLEAGDPGEISDDLFQLVGVHLTQAQQRSPVVSFRKRFPWLLCNIGGGVVAAFLSALFEEELQRAVALALFIPVVLALAESVSIQSVSLTLQTLHGQRPRWSALGPKVGRELLTGALLGAACGAVVCAVAWLWLGQPTIALSLLGGIAGGVAGAAVLGLATPYLLRLLRYDPQVAAGPIALAASDMLTLLIYFNLGRWLLA
jgi:magnesium transporter